MTDLQKVKLPKGYKVTAHPEKPAGWYPGLQNFYVGRVWIDGVLVSSTPGIYELRSKALENGRDLALRIATHKKNLQ